MDDIKQKLQEFEQKLERPDYNKELLNRTPLIFLAVGLACGIGIQNFFNLSIWLWIAAACTFALISLPFVFFYKKPNKITYLAYITFICALCLGGIRLIHYQQPAANDIQYCLPDKETIACIRGTVLTKPYVEYNKEWYFSDFTFNDPPSSFYLGVTEAKTTTGWREISGKIRVQVEEPVFDLAQGNQIEINCWLDKYRPVSNPGQFDLAGYLARKNVYVSANIKSRDSIQLINNQSDSFLPSLRSKLRQIATQSLLGTQAPERQSQNLLQALILGYRSEIDNDTYEAFRKTGLSHFISLSGINYVILIGTIWWFCKLLSISKQIRALVCVLVTVIFLLTIPPTAPAIRAAIICFVFCISLIFRRTTSSINSLSLAAIILLLIIPTDLFDAGWQLSFATVLGILLLTDKIEKPISRLINFLAGTIYFQQLPNYKNIKKILLAAATLLAASIAAWIASFGIILYHFNTAYLLSSFWTVLASPLISLISILGYIKVVLGILLPTATTAIEIILEILCSLLIDLVKIFSRVNFSEMLLGKVPFIFIAFYYVLILYAFFVRIAGNFRKKIIFIAGIIAITLAFYSARLLNNQGDSLILTALDVGHGQAIFVRLPNNINLLFDAGSINKKDIGTRIIKPFLNTKVVTHIDKIFLSHPDLDHINSVPEVIRDYKTNYISVNKVFFSSGEDLSPLAHLRKFISKYKLNFNYHQQAINFDSDSKLSCIWPNSNAVLESSGNNDLSTVFLLEFGGRKILLCSDIEKSAQKQILNLYPDLKADIMILPHHGSEKTLATEFVKNTNPGIIITSCNSQQYEKIKDLKTLNNSVYYYTAKDGAVTIKIDRKADINVTTFLK